jgi:hypothetical protein
LSSNWLNFDSWIQVTDENREKLISIIEDLKALNALKETEYEMLKDAAENLE